MFVSVLIIFLFVHNKYKIVDYNRLSYIECSYLERFTDGSSEEK